jgi:ribonucleoside-diphosphate reductase beta chain
MYKKHVASFWVLEEIDLAGDLKDWEKLSNDERHFIKMVLAFFAASDGIVNENLAVRFMKDVEIPEARCFYGFQIAMENIHAETYSALIDTYIKDEDEKRNIFQAVQTIPCVGKKAQWAIKWLEDTQASFAERLLAFMCVEGIFFSGSFCAIFWLKKRGLMPGLTFSNELISRDEGLHCEFAALLFNMLTERPDVQTIKDIILDAVDCEIEFVCDALPVELIGMNSKHMSEYIRFVANRLFKELGYGDLYAPAPSQPFEFMEMISLQGKTNFFERKVSEYSKANVSQQQPKSKIFTLDSDF